MLLVNVSIYYLFEWFGDNKNGMSDCTTLLASKKFVENDILILKIRN